MHLHFLISKEVDDIFIVFPPMVKRCPHERIFITKVGGQWKSDNSDRRLVNKLTKEIECYLSEVQQPARQ